MTEAIGIVAGTALAFSGSWALAIVVKATLALLAALAVAKLCARTRASARHLLFAAAYLALLVLPLAEAVSPTIVLRAPWAHSITSPQTGRVAADSLPQHGDISAASVSGDLARVPAISLWQALAAGWFVGMVMFSAPIALGLLQVRRLCRRGVTWPQGQSIVDGIVATTGIRKRVRLLRHRSVSGPLTCGAFKVTILVPADAIDWSADALRRALRHEVEHVRRSDWTTHCLARAVCALYWFHPLVWMAWRQIRLEAERACDDAVIAQDDAREYGLLLVAVAQRQTRDTRLPILAMARRGDLSVRVAALLNAHQRRGVVSRRWVTATVILTATVSLAAGGLTFTQSRDTGRGQSPERSFDVISIKRNVSGNQDIIINAPTAAAFSATNLAMRGIIMRAYQVKNITGAPGWVDDERYDIEARATGKPTFDEVNAMLRTMLKDRMQLKAHIEPREIPVYQLVVASPNHPGLKPFTRDCDTILAERDAAAKAGQAPASPGPTGAAPCAYAWPGGAIHSGGITMARFAGLMDYVAGRVVVDRTGLSGRYEFTVRFVFPSPAVTSSPNDVPDVFAALQEQLGLKLEPARALVDTLVIDHIERPSDN